jgi:hypothetical protein
MCHQPSEKYVMTKNIKATKERRHSAVSAIKPLTQQVSLTSQQLSELKKKMPATVVRGYRKSKTSGTMRIPFGLRGKVQALVEDYRKQQLADPDTWN